MACVSNPSISRHTPHRMKTIIWNPLSLELSIRSAMLILVSMACSAEAPVYMQLSAAPVGDTLNTMTRRDWSRSTLRAGAARGVPRLSAQPAPPGTPAVTAYVADFILKTRYTDIPNDVL